MRQRKVKNLETKYENYSGIVIDDPSVMKGSWSERAGGRPIYIEIGCGKGKFISELAAREPEHFFVAIEGNKSVMLRALEKIRDEGLTNVVFAPEFVDDLNEWFSPGEADGIYLNFSDPLPKNYWYRRRLTYRERLKSYFNVLKDDGRVVFKTDNTGLFEWSILEIQAADLRILDITRDLHALVMSIEDPEERACFNIETEYEAKFSGLGEKIKRVVIGRRTPRSEADGEVTEEMITSLAAYNGRDIDENAVNTADDILRDEEGKPVVLEAVRKAFSHLGAEDFARRTSFGETPEFRAAVMRAVFGSYEPRSYTGLAVSASGTGAIRNAILNYSCPGDRILTHEPRSNSYDTIVSELGRSVETFRLTDGEGKFDAGDFAYKVSKLLRNQEHLVIVLGTPAGSPSGYFLSVEDWQMIKSVLDGVSLEKKIALVCDATYIDYAGDETGTRQFMPIVDNLRANILPVIVWSTSWSLTMPGSGLGAMICMAHNPGIAEEFVRINKWSAVNAGAEPSGISRAVVEQIYNDPELTAEASSERAEWRKMIRAQEGAE